MWNKPHKTVEDEAGIKITAAQLCKEYAADENAANVKYLNHAISVSGVISETDKNQDGGLMIILQAEDPMQAVECAMRDKNVTAEKGKNITLKGFCSGSKITGVSLTDCVVEK